MKNDDTTHRSKCAATCRVQLMLDLSGDNTVSLYIRESRGRGNLLQILNQFTYCHHLMFFAVFSPHTCQTEQ